MKTTNAGMRVLAGAAALAMPLALSAPAFASDIVFGVIGPQEYNLPVNYQPFNAFVQYGEYNDQGKAWDGNGNLRSTSGGDLYVGLSKYVYFFTLDSVPNVGLAWEIITPEVLVSGPGYDDKGFGDPITGFAAWIKPTKDSTFGVQSFVQVPIGNNEVSNHYWANISTLLYDFQTEHLSFTGDTGVVFRSDLSGWGLPKVNESTSIFSSFRVGWKATTLWEPFIAFDWQTNTAAYYSDGGGLYAAAGNETTLGAGVMAHVTDKASITVRYSHGVEGYNTVSTNGVYIKLSQVW